MTFATMDAAAIAALLASPSTTARCSRPSGTLNPSVRSAVPGRRLEPLERAGEPAQVRSVQPDAIDLAGRDHDHADALGTGHDDVEQPLAHRVRALLGVVELAERRAGVAAQPRVVEQDRRDHERPRERAPSRLVGTGDEGALERPVEAQQAPSRPTRHPSSRRGRHGAQR